MTKKKKVKNQRAYFNQRIEEFCFTGKIRPFIKPFMVLEQGFKVFKILNLPHRSQFPGKLRFRSPDFPGS